MPPRGKSLGNSPVAPRARVVETNTLEVGIPSKHMSRLDTSTTINITLNSYRMQQRRKF